MPGDEYAGGPHPGRNDPDVPGPDLAVDLAARVAALEASPGGGAVDSVNGETGVVVLDAPDVGAQPAATGTPDGTKFLADDGSWKAPDSGGSGPFTWQYIEWTHADNGVTKSVAIPAGAQVMVGWTITLEGFDGIGGAAMTLGTDAVVDAYLSASDVSTADQVYSVADLNTGPLGFPFSHDAYTLSPGHLKGTLAVPDSAAGILRFYFVYGTPTAATLV